ncbi:MAG: SRPBCC family protein [Phycisphaerales bacterium]
MKPLLIAAPILIALLAGVVTIVVLGMLLPRHHTATRSIRLAATPQRVWDLVADISGRAAWSPGVKSIERLADRNGHSVWKESRSDGWSMTFEVESLEPPTRLVTRIADEKLPFAGSWTWEVTPEPARSGSDSEGADAHAGTRLRITERGEIRSAPFRYFAALGDMSSTIQGVLTGTASHLGEPARIEP